jgi:hypothetical protein
MKHRIDGKDFAERAGFGQPTDICIAGIFR